MHAQHLPQRLGGQEEFSCKCDFVLNYVDSSSLVISSFMASSALSDPTERSWDLSLYELHRTPQEALTGAGMEIAVSARSLQAELTCPICLDMLTQTMTTKECLHRFCAECIVTALRSGNKECPTCRKKLVSKRSLRPDPNFDQLVEKIFPNREEYEAHQESILESLSRSHSQNFITSITDGIKAQMAHAKAATKKAKAAVAPAYDGLDSPHHMPITGRGEGNLEEAGIDGVDETSLGTPPKKKKKLKMPTPIMGGAAADNGADSDGGTGSGGMVSSTVSKEVEIVFKLHPCMSDQPREVVDAMRESATRYIKTTARAQIEHLCQYLAMRISLDLPPSIVAAATPAGYSSLPTPGSSSGTGSKHTLYVVNTLVVLTHLIYLPGNKPNLVKDLTIYVGPTPGNIVVLAGSMTLTQVNDKYWKVNKPMEMFYSFNMA